MTQVPPTRYSSAIMTRAPWPAAMRPARTPAEPPPMTKRSTSNRFMAAFANGLGIVAEPHDCGTDRRRPPALPGAMADHGHGRHGGHKGEAHRDKLVGKLGDRGEKKHQGRHAENGADGPQ